MASFGRRNRACLTPPSRVKGDVAELRLNGVTMGKRVAIRYRSGGGYGWTSTDHCSGAVALTFCDLSAVSWGEHLNSATVSNNSTGRRALPRDRTRGKQSVRCRTCCERKLLLLKRTRANWVVYALMSGSLRVTILRRRSRATIDSSRTKFSAVGLDTVQWTGRGSPRSLAA